MKGRRDIASMHTYSISPHYVIAVIKAAEKIGLPVQNMPEITDLLAVCEAGERVPLQLFCQVLQNFVENSGDADIGLRLGSELEPACFNVLGHLVMACTSVGDALRYVQQLQDLVIDCADADCTQVGDQLVFRWTPRCEFLVAEKPLLDLVLSATRNFGIWITGIAEPFTEVWFQYRAPANTEVCQQVFGHMGCYGCDCNAFVIPLAWAQRPIKSASENLQPLIFMQAQTQWETIKRQDGFVALVSETLTRLLPLGTANIERVAEALNLSSRSLQRRLSEHGKNFSDLLQQVRLQQANYYLRHTTMSLSEITACLGYSEQSSFSNAYKAWTGQSPRQWRNFSDTQFA